MSQQFLKSIGEDGKYRYFIDGKRVSRNSYEDGQIGKVKSNMVTIRRARKSRAWRHYTTVSGPLIIPIELGKA